MVSSTILTLVVIPALYALWKERAVRAASRSRDARHDGFVPAPPAGALAGPEIDFATGRRSHR